MNEESDNEGAENSLGVTVHYTAIDLDWLPPTPRTSDDDYE